MAAASPLRAPADGSHHHPTPTPLSPGPEPAAAQAHPAATPRPDHGHDPVAHDFAMDPSHSQMHRGPSNAGSRFTEDWDASQRGSSILDGSRSSRPASRASTAAEDAALSRGNTLRKKASLRRSGSLKRSGSKRSMRAGSVRSLALQAGADEDERRSAFYCPVPTKGNPTDALASRFQAWRKLLKELIAYFKEVQSHYEARAKSNTKLSHAAHHVTPPVSLLTAEGGLDEAMRIVRRYNDAAARDTGRAQEVLADVILALTGLRSDLQTKIKEIKNLSGDFRNGVDKEMDGTRKTVKALQDVLGQAEMDAASVTGKQDPYLMRMAVDRQVERQIDEENYLHQAYLNLETSGRELEAIVVGEVQKAYNAYASILKREAESAYATVDELRVGPIEMPSDHEWSNFMRGNDQFVDPALPVRASEDIHYPGRDHGACQEVRAGLLERKSKYLKSYTAGWYVLSPTHLHEFKSADKAQAPVMSLYLPEQKLGSHSQEGGSSQKFILKGRQTGGIHRGHTWVFRAESHDTMMAWYADLKVLTERTPQQRIEMFGQVTRSGSRASRRSTSSDARVVDEEDDEPFAAGDAVDVSGKDGTPVKRPQAGGRFPSDIHVNAQRGIDVGGSPSSGSSGLANGHVNFAGGDPRDAGPVYDRGYGAYADGARMDEASHVATATHGAHDGRLYQPTPIHGATATNIYQYQTPSRGNSYAEGVTDGARRQSQDTDGNSYLQGVVPNSYHGAGVTYQHPSHPYEQPQEKEFTAPPAQTPISAGNANTENQPRGIADGEQAGTEDAPKQGVARTSTSTSMHVPGDYPKSGTNLPDGAAGQN